jgi:hypothetical protein
MANSEELTEDENSDIDRAKNTKLVCFFEKTVSAL